MTIISELTYLLIQARKPLILLGAGARGGAEYIIAFAERFDIPIMTTWNAIDLIEWDHRLFMGRPGAIAYRGTNKILQECDLLLSIGARLDVQTIAFEYGAFAPNAVHVIVDVDMHELAKFPEVDLVITEDSGQFATELVKIADSITASTIWLQQCTEVKNRLHIEGKGISYDICGQLSEWTTPDDVLVFSTTGTVGGTIFPAFFHQKKGQRVILSSCGLGSMGAGIPAAIGASLASGKRVICIDGDGSFCQNMQELEVVHRLGLNIIFIVFNNGGYASIRNSEQRTFGRVSGNLTLPNIADLAFAFKFISDTYTPEKLRHYLALSFSCVLEVEGVVSEDVIPRVMYDGKGNLGNMFPYEERS